jgi:hypothetical protein
MRAQGFLTRILQMLETADKSIQEYGTWAIGKFVENDSTCMY